MRGTPEPRRNKLGVRFQSDVPKTIRTGRKAALIQECYQKRYSSFFDLQNENGFQSRIIPLLIFESE